MVRGEGVYQVHILFADIIKKKNTFCYESLLHNIIIYLIVQKNDYDIKKQILLRCNACLHKINYM